MQNKKNSKTVASHDDLEELDDSLRALGQRTVVHFLDAISTTLDNPNSTPLRIEIEYWPKYRLDDEFGPSAVYCVKGRGQQVQGHMSKEDIDLVRDWSE